MVKLNNVVSESRDCHFGFRSIQIHPGVASVLRESTPHLYLSAVAHAPPAMVLFFLFLFLPLLFAFVLTAIAALYKPGCAVSAVDTSSV